MTDVDRPSPSPTLGSLTSGCIAEHHETYLRHLQNAVRDGRNLNITEGSDRMLTNRIQKELVKQICTGPLLAKCRSRDSTGSSRCRRPVRQVPLPKAVCRQPSWRIIPHFGILDAIRDLQPVVQLAVRSRLFARREYRTPLPMRSTSAPDPAMIDPSFAPEKNNTAATREYQDSEREGYIVLAGRGREETCTIRQ